MRICRFVIICICRNMSVFLIIKIMEVVNVYAQNKSRPDYTSGRLLNRLIEWV